MDITQQDFDYFILASLAFKAAGPEGHYPCSASNPTGKLDTPDGTRMCVIYRTYTALGVSLHSEVLKKEWQAIFGEGMTETNERGYETVCESFDHLIGYYAPQFMPDYLMSGNADTEQNSSDVGNSGHIMGLA